MNKEQLNILGCLDVIEFLMSKHRDEDALAILATAVVSKIYDSPGEERAKAIRLFWEAFEANMKRYGQMEKEEQ